MRIVAVTIGAILALGGICLDGVAHLGSQYAVDLFGGKLDQWPDNPEPERTRKQVAAAGLVLLLLGACAIALTYV